MTNQRAIFELIKYRRRLEEKYPIDAEPFDMAIEALKAQLSAKDTTLDDVSTAYENGYKQGKFEAQQWIPVSDRLPDKDFTDYLVQIGHGKYAVYETAYRVRGRWVFYSDRIDGEGQSVIAWMECPLPYTEEEQ